MTLNVSFSYGGWWGVTQMRCSLKRYHKINVALSVTAFALTSLSTIEDFSFFFFALVVFCKAASAGGEEEGGKKKTLLCKSHSSLNRV